MRGDERPPLALQLVFLAKHLDHLIEHKLAVHGLNRTQALTLMALKRHEGLNAMALCAHARVEPANVTRTLQSLERLDLVERRPHPTDGRAQLFYLTARGRSMAETVGSEMGRLSSEILDSMDEEEARCLEMGLRGLWRTLLKRLEVESYRLTAISHQLSAVGSRTTSANPRGATVLRNEELEASSSEDDADAERR